MFSLNTDSPRPFNMTSEYLGKTFNTVIGITNLWLALQIAVLNGIVIAYYRRSVRKTVPFMYTTLSVTDTVTGVAAFLNGLLFLILEYNPEPASRPPGNYLIVPTYFIFSITFRVSVLLNLIISIVRTINIILPFYRIRRSGICGAVVLYVLVSAALSITLLHVRQFDFNKPSRNDLEDLLYKPSGYQIMAVEGNISVEEELRNITVFIALPFVLPSLITLVCMAIQIRAVLKPNPTRNSHNDNQKDITKTILMLTLLFFFCNTVYILYPVMYYKKHILKNHAALGLSHTEQLRLQYCLGVLCPYINAAFNPAILIWRGKDIRRSLRSKISKVLPKQISKSKLSMRLVSPRIKTHRRLKYLTTSQL